MPAIQPGEPVISTVYPIQRSTHRKPRVCTVSANQLRSDGGSSWKAGSSWGDRCRPSTSRCGWYCGTTSRLTRRACAHSLGSFRCSLAGSAGGNMRSYTSRASRIRRARSRSDFGINRTTSPMCAPRQDATEEANIMPSRERGSQPTPVAHTAPLAMSVMPAMKSTVSARVSIQSPRMMRLNRWTVRSRLALKR
jgi:hypothetical protein